ncbi:MAG: DUF938 domain-containing protein [Henriciella sp.]
MTEQDKAYPKSAVGQPLALEPRPVTEDGRRFSPSVARNRDVLAEAFAQVDLRSGHVLEIASGTGEHGAYLTAAFERLHWTYSDIDPDSQASQRAWKRHMNNSRLSGPHIIDTSKSDWGKVEAAGPYDAIFCANMIHIAPFAAAEGLFAGAGRALHSGAPLCLYGPFARGGEIAPSNARFRDDLQRRDPSWGVRDLDLQLVPVAKNNGLHLQTVIEMPANNLFVCFYKT